MEQLSTPPIKKNEAKLEQKKVQFLTDREIIVQEFGKELSFKTHQFIAVLPDSIKEDIESALEVNGGRFSAQDIEMYWEENQLVSGLDEADENFTIHKKMFEQSFRKYLRLRAVFTREQVDEMCVLRNDEKKLQEFLLLNFDQEMKVLQEIALEVPGILKENADKHVALAKKEDKVIDPNSLDVPIVLYGPFMYALHKGPDSVPAGFVTSEDDYSGIYVMGVNNQKEKKDIRRAGRTIFHEQGHIALKKINGVDNPISQITGQTIKTSGKGKQIRFFEEGVIEFVTHHKLDSENVPRDYEGAYSKYFLPFNVLTKALYEFEEATEENDYNSFIPTREARDFFGSLLYDSNKIFELQKKLDDKYGYGTFSSFLALLITTDTQELWTYLKTLDSQEEIDRIAQRSFYGRSEKVAELKQGIETYFAKLHPGVPFDVKLFLEKQPAIAKILQISK